MQMSKTTVLAGVLLLALVASAWGYSLCGYKWKTTNPMGEPYYVYANTSDCTGELAAVQAGAAAWNGAGAHFTFSYGGSTTRSAPRYDNYNVIRWANLSGGIIAQTSIWVYSADPTSIAECDMVFNDRFLWNSSSSCPSNRMDVQNIAAHEFGHFLCLADLYNSADYSKTMYGYADYGETYKRTLETDDKNGIRYLYP
jgi:hypothetical protein